MKYTDRKLPGVARLGQKERSRKMSDFVFSGRKKKNS